MLKAWMLASLLGLRVLMPSVPLEYYVFQFHVYKDIYLNRCIEQPKVTIQLAILPDGIIGYCEPLGPEAVVTLDEEFWNGATDLQREELMFHELGHCVLHRMHNDNTIKHLGKEMPASLMKSVGLLDNYYALFRDYYIQELFTEP